MSVHCCYFFFFPIADSGLHHLVQFPLWECSFSCGTSLYLWCCWTVVFAHSHFMMALHMNKQKDNCDVLICINISLTGHQLSLLFTGTFLWEAEGRHNHLWPFIFLPDLMDLVTFQKNDSWGKGNVARACLSVWELTAFTLPDHSSSQASWGITWLMTASRGLNATWLD